MKAFFIRLVNEDLLYDLINLGYSDKQHSDLVIPEPKYRDNLGIYVDYSNMTYSIIQLWVFDTDYFGYQVKCIDCEKDIDKFLKLVSK